MTRRLWSWVLNRYLADLEDDGEPDEDGQRVVGNGSTDVVKLVEDRRGSS